MNIDLSLLHSNTVSDIDISGKYNISNDYYENSSIIRLEEVTVSGSIFLKENE